MLRRLVCLGVFGLLFVSGAILGCAERHPPAEAPPPALAQPTAQARAQAATRQRVAASREPSAPRPAPLPPRAEINLVAELAESKAAAKLVSIIVGLRDAVATTRYQARTKIDTKRGHYAWDCSGMANWIVARAAPRARRALAKSRPRAIDYYKAISTAPESRARRGWQRLGHVSAARPGDLFAFPKSPLSKSKISGHVGFFVGTPWRVKDWPHEGEAWAARILDATGLPHQDDTRDRDSEGGFGFGTFLFVNDDAGETVAYGWFGTASRGFLPTTVAYGRVTK